MRAPLLLLALLAGPLSVRPAQAHAPPPPVLGPDGPLHLGPLLPGDGDPRGEVMVDPLSGQLFLALPGLAGRFTWDGRTWELDDEPLDGPDDLERQRAERREPGQGETQAPTTPGLRWEWTGERLSGIVDPQGGRVRLTSDSLGRPRRIEWFDGSRVDLRYDDFGRLVLTQGPGPEDHAFAWRDGGVVATDPRGSPLTIRPSPGTGPAARALLVVDALGRTARTFFGPDDQLLGWEDPRGLQTWVERRDGTLELRDGLGRSWRVERDGEGRVRAVDLPGGRRWTWRRGGADQLIGIEDPTGRVHRWVEEGEGRLVNVGLGTASWTLRRDPAGRVQEVVGPAGAVTALQRDPAGRVVAIVDALGNELRIERRATGEPLRIAERTGASWRFEHDVFGRVERIADPADGRLDIRRNSGGAIVALIDLRRGRFDLARGTGGLLTRIQAPSGDRLELQHDALGRLSQLRQGEGSRVQVGRDALGEVVRLRAEPAEGGAQVVVVRRDANGAPLSAGPVSWRRDASGRVVGIDGPGRRLRMALDATGRLLGARTADWWLSLSRDGSGRVVQWSGSDGVVDVRRDGAGRIIEERVDLQAAPPGPGLPPAPDDDALPPEPVESAPAPVDDPLAAWLSGAAGPEEEGDTGAAGDTGAPATDPLATERDHLGTWADELGLSDPGQPAGEGLAEAGLEGEGSAGDLLGPQFPAERRVVLDRDLAGRVQRVRYDDDDWRIMRDAAGRMLRLTGPGGLAVGADRDDAGRVSLVRLARGALARLAWAEDDRVLVFRGTDGVKLDSRLEELDALDRIGRDSGGRFGARGWTRDGAGNPLVIESASGMAWSFGPAGSTGPDGEQLRFDADGRVVEARPPTGPAAWGVGAHVLSYAWSEASQLLQVAGELGAVAVLQDGLGRLRALHGERGEHWSLRYDARGRLSEVQRGGRRLHELVWAPVDERAAGLAPPQAGPAAGIEADDALLGSGPAGRHRWLWGPWGPAVVRVGERLGEVMLDPAGMAWWSQGPDGPALRSSEQLRGYPEVAQELPALDLVGPAGSLQIFPGGPLMAPSAGPGTAPAGVALDPLSGQRIDGLSPWAWQPTPLFAEGDVARLDPTPWRAQALWSEPLALLRALGEIEEPVDGRFVALPGDGSPHPQLPRGLEQPEPPLGPPLQALPLDLDPLTEALLLAALPGGTAPDPDLAIRVLLADELDLPWLPPGLQVPLPPGWISQSE